MTDDLKDKFIEDFVNLPFDKEYFENIYGADQVSAWFADVEIRRQIKIKMAEKKQLRANEKDLYLKEVLSLRNKAIENIIKILNDPTHKEYARISLSLMSSERAYLDAFFKTRGEIDAQSGNDKQGTILELIYAKKAD